MVAWFCHGQRSSLLKMEKIFLLLLKVALNRNNINKAEATLFNTYKDHTTGSLYDVAEKCPFWSLMHEGISKFGHSL